jgi:uncharacterized membrane protein
MSGTQLTYVVIGVGVVALLVGFQMRTRPLRENSSTRLTLILAVIGIVEVYNAAKGHTLGTTTVAWTVGSLIVGGVLGALRAMTVKVWRDENGSAFVKGTVLTAALWVVSLGAHLAIEVGINDSTKIAGFGASSLLLYLAVTLGAQRETVRRRAPGGSTPARPSRVSRPR